MVVLCVLLPGGGGGGGVEGVIEMVPPPFCWAYLCLFIRGGCVPQKGPGTSPGQLSILRGGIPDVGLIAEGL